MTRFWITLQQGVDFVLSCFAQMRGGEIFVPKIPSMRIVDLANHLAPGVAHEITSVRPGEKLHELMVARDDARVTVELDDRYVIEPSFAFWPRESRLEGGATPVPEDFKYASDNNTEWLEPADLEKLLAETDL
jgi:UDP-N-acetylglucosamine 4,6-dehydratase